MGFFNNGEIWEQQKSPAFSFFNGAAPGRLQESREDSEIIAFIIHTVRLRPGDKVTGAERQRERNVVFVSPNIWTVAKLTGGRRFRRRQFREEIRSVRGHIRGRKLVPTLIHHLAYFCFISRASYFVFLWCRLVSILQWKLCNLCIIGQTGNSGISIEHWFKDLQHKRWKTVRLKLGKNEVAVSSVLKYDII